MNVCIAVHIEYRYSRGVYSDLVHLYDYNYCLFLLGGEALGLKSFIVSEAFRFFKYEEQSFTYSRHKIN